MCVSNDYYVQAQRAQSFMVGSMVGATQAVPMSSPCIDARLPGKSHTQLRIGDTIALCVQRRGKFCFVGSEGFIELGCSLRELTLWGGKINDTI